MPFGEHSLVFVYCHCDECIPCRAVIAQLHQLHYDAVAFCWDGVGEATDDELAAFDVADYRLLLDLCYQCQPHEPGQAPRQLLDRALRTGKPTIELSRTGPTLQRRFEQGVVRRVHVGQDPPHDAMDALQQDGWRPRQPWRVTALAEVLVALLGAFRPIHALKRLPCMAGPSSDPADWWAALSACLALAASLATKPYRLLVAALFPWPWLAQLAFHESVAILSAFACLDIVSIVVTQVDILFLARRREERQGRAFRRVSRERTLLCALLNYATIVFWFAGFYQWFPRLFRAGAGLEFTRPLDALYISLANMSLMGAEVEARHPWGRAILLAQLTLGLFMALVVVAQAVGSIEHRSMGEP